MFHIAVIYYQEVLNIADECSEMKKQSREMQEMWEMFSLEKAAAYNLCTILKSSGSNALAVKLRKRYLCFD